MSQGSPEGGTEQARTKHAWPFESPVISTMSQVRTRNIQDVLVLSTARQHPPCPRADARPRPGPPPRASRRNAQLLFSARGEDMTLCPIALAVHCIGCPIVKVCPAKRMLGDYGTYLPSPV